MGLVSSGFFYYFQRFGELPSVGRCFPIQYNDTYVFATRIIDIATALRFMQRQSYMTPWWKPSRTKI